MAMNGPAARFKISRSVIGTLFVIGLMGAMLFAAGTKDYPSCTPYWTRACSCCL